MPEFKRSDWLIDCEPRDVQIEALNRSYMGVALRDTLTGPEDLRELPHYGSPARGWGHFLEMRLGKTPLTLNEFLLLRRDHGIRRMVVFAPHKFKMTWETEAKKFGIDAPTHVYEAKAPEGTYQKFLDRSREGGILIVNYEAVCSARHRNRIGAFCDGHDYMAVLDESATIKNPSAQRTKAIGPLCERASYVRLLSGLPAPYAPYDLWSQLRAMGTMNTWNNFHVFKHTFTRMGGWKNKQALGIQNEDALNEIMFLRTFRAKKVDWGLNIGVDYELVPLEMTKAQMAAHREMELEFTIWLDSSTFVSAESAMTKMAKLRQISSGFIYGEGYTVHTIEPFEKTPKFLDLVDRLDNRIEGKVIVIAEHRETTQKLMEHLKRYRPALISGDVSPTQTEREKERFNNDDRCRVMVGQSKSIKYGHTLVGSKAMPCYSLCFFENGYNLDTRMQCEARPQGGHQVAQVHIWDYHSSPVEKKITRALQKREKISDVIMGHYKGASASDAS